MIINRFMVPYLQNRKTLPHFVCIIVLILSIVIDLNCVPEYVANQFFLRTLIDVAKLVSHDFLWLKGTLSIKVNLKSPGILEILKSFLFPRIKYELKGFILRIPIISIQEWYQSQEHFHDPFVLDLLNQCRNDFGLVNGRNDQAFQCIQLMEQMAHREIRSLAIPYNRDQQEFEEMERLLEDSATQEAQMKVASTCTDKDVLELTRKLHESNLK